MKIIAIEKLVSLLFFWKTFEVKLNVLTQSEIAARDFVPYKELPQSNGKKILILQYLRLLSSVVRRKRIPCFSR